MKVITSGCHIWSQNCLSKTYREILITFSKWHIDQNFVVPHVDIIWVLHYYKSTWNFLTYIKSGLTIKISVYDSRWLLSTALWYFMHLVSYQIVTLYLSKLWICEIWGSQQWYWRFKSSKMLTLCCLVYTCSSKHFQRLLFLYPLLVLLVLVAEDIKS